MSDSHQPVRKTIPTDVTAVGFLTLSSAIGHAFGGALLGGVFGYMLGPYFIFMIITFEKMVAWVAPLGLKLEQTDLSWLSAALGAAIGAVGGVIEGAMADARKARRDQGLQQVAKSLGARLFASSAPELSEKLQRFFPGIFSPDVGNVVRMQVQGIRVTVGEVGVLSARDETHRSTRRFAQILAYYESDTLRFPGFSMQPEGFVLHLIAEAIGIVDVDFPAQPEFSRSYHLTADHAESTRKLFNDTLLQALGRRPGLCIASGSGSLVLYRPGKLYEAEELKGFVSEAAEIFRLFEDAARKSGLTAESIRAAETDIKARFAEIPGLIGKIARETLVTRADVDAFVRQSTPRKIPANIRSYSDGVAPGWAVLFGMGFAVMGTALAYLFGYTALSGGRGLIGANATGILVGLACLGIGGIGGSIAFFAGRARIRIKRLLRNGRISGGSIERIDDTGMGINHEAISLMTVQYPVEGWVVQASCEIRGHAVQRAQTLAADKKPASILYNPADPQRIMFVDSLLSVGPEYEP